MSLFEYLARGKNSWETYLLFKSLKTYLLDIDIDIE